MKYPISREIFGGYFHQDWNYCGPDWQSIVDQICKEDTHQGLEEWVIELLRILKDFSEDELGSALYPVFQLNYIPSDNGLGNKEWIHLVINRVENYLKVVRGSDSES